MPHSWLQWRSSWSIFLVFDLIEEGPRHHDSFSSSSQPTLSHVCQNAKGGGESYQLEVEGPSGQKAVRIPESSAEKVCWRQDGWLRRVLKGVHACHIPLKEAWLLQSQQCRAEMMYVGRFILRNIHLSQTGWVIFLGLSAQTIKPFTGLKAQGSWVWCPPFVNEQLSELYSSVVSCHLCLFLKAALYYRLTQSPPPNPPSHWHPLFSFIWVSMAIIQKHSLS